jgi:hypothetical protein
MALADTSHIWREVLSYVPLVSYERLAVVSKAWGLLCCDDRLCHSWIKSNVSGLLQKEPADSSWAQFLTRGVLPKLAGALPVDDSEREVAALLPAFVAARWGFEKLLLVGPPSLREPRSFPWLGVYLQSDGSDAVSELRARQLLHARLAAFLQCDFDLQDTFLHVAATHGHGHVIDAVSRASRLSATTPTGPGPAGAAGAAGGAAGSCALGLEIKNGFGATPLLAATYHNHLSCTRSLLAAGANTEARSRAYLQTALCTAASRGHLAVAEVLLQHGADEWAKDADGWDAPMIARNQSHNAVAEFIVRWRETMNT